MMSEDTKRWTPDEIQKDARRQGDARRDAMERKKWVDDAAKSLLDAGVWDFKVASICDLYDQIQAQCPIPEVVMPDFSVKKTQGES